MILRAPIRFGLDDLIREEIESLHPVGCGCPRPGALTVIVETTGGYIEVVERIYNVFRKHYNEVNFIVPNYAYSAGTVLVLSGDEIYMDYYSVLGPIDPQMENNNEQFVSCIGYLAKYNQLVAKINSAASTDAVRAELAYLLKNFDPAELFGYEQSRSHSEDLLESWLSKHKFKDWTETETSKRTVDEDLRKVRAKEIAAILGNPERWHSHGRGIGMKELMSEEIKLKIRDFGADSGLRSKVSSYYNLFMDYAKRLGLGSSSSVSLHTPKGFRRT